MKHSEFLLLSTYCISDGLSVGIALFHVGMSTHSHLMVTAASLSCVLMLGHFGF